MREFTRRGGRLRRREARELLKVDVNKTSRVWDFLVQAGVLKIPSLADQSGCVACSSFYCTVTEHSQTRFGRDSCKDGPRSIGKS